MNSIIRSSSIFSSKHLNSQKLLNFFKSFQNSKSSKFFYSTEIEKIETKSDEIIEWKKNVIIKPIQTTKDDLLRKHKTFKDGFYINHRYYIEKTPDSYTIEPFKTKRTGGRDLETKERLFRRVGGGLPVIWYWVDFKRVGPNSGPPLVEKVIDIFASRDRTAFIALVAHGNYKRYILATKNMKVGDLIRTSGEIPKNPVKAYEGDAYPVGALPMGTIIHNIELEPGLGGEYCKAAGAYATLIRKIDNRCIVKLPSGLEISIDEKCMVVIGQVSHVTHKDEKLTHAVDIRDLGYRPRSGLWQKKDGRFGHKITPPKPIKIMGEKQEIKYKRVPYTYFNWSITE